LQQFSQMMDSLVSSDLPIVFEDSANRRKLLRALADRSEAVLRASDCDTLHVLGELYDRVQRTREASDSRNLRIADLQARRTALIGRRRALRQQKEAALHETQAELALRRSKIDEQLQVDESRIVTLYPGEDDRKYSRWSRQLLDMRSAATRYVRAGDYGAAITLQQQADEAEALERSAHAMSWSHTCEKIREQGMAHQEKTRGAFESWCGRQASKASQKFDPQIDALTKMIQATDRDLELLYRASSR
jgi:hypothetical protein